ncbi:hypothetical protein NC652_030583 [Populus alba x Populus x berolinensis]|nr:hypothetical protein NC652_030583 [Populus alba x Populus x berolinensis]
MFFSDQSVWTFCIFSSEFQSPRKLGLLQILKRGSGSSIYASCQIYFNLTTKMAPRRTCQKMGSKNRIMIFAAIVMHLFLHFPSQTEAGAESVSEVCKQSQDYESCVQILTSHPRTLSASGKKAIAEKDLALARKESVDTSDFFTVLAHRNPASKTVLERCASYFKEAVTFLNLKGLAGGTASLDVHYALDDAESCETALSSGHVHIHSATARILKWKTVYEAAEAAVVALEN